MADMISRAAAIDYLMTNMELRYDDGYEVDDADEKRAIITDLVNGIPAVDAAPVVHAYWLDCSEGNDGTVCRKCSACKDMQIHYYTYYPNYCPECGAKMDGERRDSE